MLAWRLCCTKQPDGLTEADMKQSERVEEQSRETHSPQHFAVVAITYCCCNRPKTLTQQVQTPTHAPWAACVSQFPLGCEPPFTFKHIDIYRIEMTAFIGYMNGGSCDKEVQ